MIPFHSVEASQAVTEIAPPRPERFRELSAAKDFIAELRKKRASFRSIADLLTQHSLPISKSAVAEFCHEVLGEISRPNQRRPRKRPPSSRRRKRAENFGLIRMPFVTSAFFCGTEQTRS